MLQHELVREELMLNVQIMSTVYAPNIAHDKTPEFMRMMREHLNTINRLAQYGWRPDDTPEQRAQVTAQKAAVAFKQLRESGVLEMFDRKATELHNRTAAHE